MVQALRLVESPDRQAATLALAADGDPAAQARVAAQWTPVVYRFAHRILGHEEDARDAAQDTMVKVLRALPGYDPDRSFSTWVFGIARNTCIDQIRRRRNVVSEGVEDMLVDQGPTALGEAVRHQRAERVHAALARLPEAYREVLVLFHFEHLKYVEIAELLGEPLGTTMNRIFRARKRMAELLDLDEGDAFLGGVR